MRNKKAILSTLSVALIVAIVLSFTLVFMLPNNMGTTQGSTQEQGQTNVYTMPGSQSNDITFLVVANGSYDIDKDVVVTDSKGAEVAFRVEEMAGKKFMIHSPEGGYQDGRTYTIKVFGNVTFAQYSDYTVINFTIYAEDSEDVAIKDNVVEIPYTDVVVRRDDFLQINASSKYASEIGNGTIVIAYAEDDINNIGDFDPTTINKLCSVAYRVEGFNVSGGVMTIYASKPSVEDVYEKINVHINRKATGDDAIALNSKVYESEMANSELVRELSAAGLGAAEISKPTFEFVDGKFVFDATVTFTGQYGKIVLNFNNVLAINLVANIGKDITENFKIGVDIANTSTASVKINVDGSGTKIANVKDVFEQVQNKIGTSSSMGKIFTWTLPIATGFNISYDIDFVFRYNFSGSLDAKVVTEICWNAGLVVADGKMQPYSNVYGNVVEAGVEMRAVVNLKGGVINYININILTLIGAGFEIEVGAYSDIYGAAKVGYKNGKTAEIDGFAAGGAVYADNGFYYDIRLKAHIGINNLLSTDIAVDIYSGKESLWEVGEQEFMYGLKDIGNSADPTNPYDTMLVLSSKNSRLPIHEVDYWNIVSNTHRYKAVPFEDITFTSNLGDNSNIIIDKETGRITLKEGVTEVDEYITAEIANVKAGSMSYVCNTIRVVLESGNPILDTDEYTYDKNFASDIVIPFTLNAYALEDNILVGINGYDITEDDYTVNTDNSTDATNAKLITISSRYLRTLPTGNLTFTIETIVNGRTLMIPLYVNVETELQANAFGSGSTYDPYVLYCADQVQDFARMASNNEITGKIFVLGNDVNMYGAEIAITQFDGILDGKGYAIKNFTTSATNGNVAGFVAVNKGTIQNITIEGTVSTSFAEESYVGLVAGRNEGYIDNVVAKGTVKNHTGMLILSTTINMGGIAGINDGSIANSTAETAFVGVSQLDVAWCKHVVGGVTAKNNGSVINAIHNATDLKSKVTLSSDQGPSLFIKIGLTVNAIY